MLIEAALHYICSPVVAPVCLLLGRAALLERETTWASCLAASLPPAPNYSISVISTQHALPPVSTADSIFRYAAVQQLCSRKAELCECASPARGNAAWWYMVCSCSTLVTCLAGRGPAIGHSNSWGPVGATGLQEQQAAAHRPPSSADSSPQCATHTRTTVEQATDYEHCHPRLPCIIISKTGISAQCTAARPHCCCSRRRHQQAYE